MENKTATPSPQDKKHWYSSRSSIVSFFAAASFLLMIPLITLLVQEPQDIRERASEPIPSVTSVLQQTVKSVSGYVFSDTNQNGERESQERAYPGATIRITKLNSQGSSKDATEVAQVVSEVKTDANGYFKYTLPTTPQQTTSYVIKLILPDGYKTIDTNPVVLSSTGESDKEVVEFGLFPIAAPAITGTLGITSAPVRTTQVTPVISPTQSLR